MFRSREAQPRTRYRSHRAAIMEASSWSPPTRRARSPALGRGFVVPELSAERQIWILTDRRGGDTLRVEDLRTSLRRAIQDSRDLIENSQVIVAQAAELAAEIEAARIRADARHLKHRSRSNS